MSEFPEYYPPSPKGVPEDLTEPSVMFRKQSNLVLFSLWMFFLLYFGLIIILSLGVIYCLTTPAASRHSPWPFFRWVFAIGLSFPIFLLVKNMFRTRHVERSNEVEIFEEDHPKLWKFLECVCEETGAPMPDRVLIVPDVNAFAGTDISLASLFSQHKHSLYLGLGLINFINMTEFKALLCHEFGHLSQHSMKTAPFLRVAMSVVDNMLGNSLEKKRFMAWADKLLQFVFIIVIRMHRGLSREMEFHADMIATSCAGSDAVPQMLFKCYWAEICLQQALHDLDAASEHEMYTTDIFYHQRHASPYLRHRHRNPKLFAPPPMFEEPDRTYQLFPKDSREDEEAKMWSTHPPNFERELNTKAHYIRSNFDERSPWILFGDREALREEITARFYQDEFNIPRKRRRKTAERVQEFIDEEHAETSFDADLYGVLYNRRLIETLDLRDLRNYSEENPHTPMELIGFHRTMYTKAVRDFAEVFHRHLDEYNMLEAIVNDWYEPPNNYFEIRGDEFHVREAKRIMKKVKKEFDTDLKWLAKFDRKVFITYFELAWLLDRKLAEELYQRYRFHYVLQSMSSILRDHDGAMNFVFHVLSNAQNHMLNEQLYHLIISILRDAYKSAKKVLEEAKMVKFPVLANMPAGEPIRPFLLNDYLPDKPTHFDTSIRIDWLVEFTTCFREMQRKLARLHYKSLGNILLLQTSIAADAIRKWDPKSAPPPVPKVDAALVIEKRDESEKRPQRKATSTKSTPQKKVAR